MTRPLDKPDLRTANEAMRRATVASNDRPDSPWDSTPHRVRDVTADVIDAPAHGDVLTLLRLRQDRYSSVEEDEEVAV